MKELRCLVFTEREVVSAVIDRRRRRRDPLPTGGVAGVTYSAEHGVETRIRFMDEGGRDETLVLPEAEVLAALLAFCMGRKIPLPADSDKFLYLVNDRLALMITMNFNKPPRMITGTGDIETRPARRPSVM